MSHPASVRDKKDHLPERPRVSPRLASGFSLGRDDDKISQYDILWKGASQMTDSAPQRRPDLMDAPDVPFDTMAGGLEPEGTSPDVMAAPQRPSGSGRKSAGADFDLMRVAR
jgi:hypothetical protein